MIQLTTQRLLIRDHIAQDLESHHRLFSSQDSMRYWQEEVFHCLSQSRENLQMTISQIDAPDRTCYFLRMEDRNTGAHIGEIGYTVTAFTPMGKLVGVGYSLHREHWGHGYAAEGLAEIIRFAFEENGVYRISSGCLKENAASERVMQKCGMIHEAAFKEYQWHEGRLKDRVEYRLLRHEWQKHLPCHFKE